MILTNSMGAKVGCSLYKSGILVSDEGQLGWEFGFLVLISGTSIRRGIPAPFQFTSILVGLFFNFPAGKSSNRNPELEDSKFRYFFT
jgi:hypothetical protein